jgi:hypothetical protein
MNPSKSATKHKFEKDMRRKGIIKEKALKY